MPSLRNSLIHEATSLYEFVDSVDRFVAEHEDLFTYNDATVSYFSFVHREVRKTKDAILAIVAESGSSDNLRAKLILEKDR